MEIRKWQVKQALQSAVLLAETLSSLTEKEVHYCLDLESETRRRKSLIESLINRAAKFNKQHYIKSLKEKHHVTSPIKDPVCL